MLADEWPVSRSGTVTLAGATSPEWAAKYVDIIDRHGIAARFVHDGAELLDVLTADWSIDLVILDLALATPELVTRLRPTGPRLLAFGDPANAGLAFAANLADFIDEDISAEALIAAIRAAVAVPVPAGLADLSDRSAARLGLLGAEAERIMAALARLNEPAMVTGPPPVDLAALRATIKARRAREKYFPAEILADPGWDMLLDLTAARAEERRVSVSSLCIAACVPTTTGLRWIRKMCDSGIFERRDDPVDTRRAFITLAEPTAASMALYLGGFA